MEYAKLILIFHMFWNGYWPWSKKNVLILNFQINMLLRNHEDVVHSIIFHLARFEWISLLPAMLSSIFMTILGCGFWLLLIFFPFDSLLLYILVMSYVWLCVIVIDALWAILCLFFITRKIPYDLVLTSLISNIGVFTNSSWMRDPLTKPLTK